MAKKKGKQPKKQEAAKKPLAHKPGMLTKVPSMKSGRGLKMARVPSLALREGLKSVVVPKKADPIEQAVGLVKDAGTINDMVADDLTEGQKCLHRCRAQAVPLLKDPEFERAIAGLVGLRQAYVVFYNELDKLIRAQEGLAPEMGDFLIQLAAYQASKAFNEHTLMQNIVNGVLPSLAEIIDKHAETDKEEADKARKEQAEKKMATHIPIGFKHHSECEHPTLERERSLVLAGWEPALLWLMDQIMTNVLKAREDDTFTVIRFMDKAPRPEDQHVQLVRIGGKMWHGICNSKTSLPMFVGQHIVKQLTSQPDLIMVDNLALAHNAGFVGRPPAAAGGDAHRAFRHWCDSVSATLVGCIPTDSKEPPDIREPEWEQLRTFTHLRFITVLDKDENLAEDKYRIIVGTSAAIFDVEKTAVDAYARGTILTPGGIHAG